MYPWSGRALPGVPSIIPQHHRTEADRNHRVEQFTNRMDDREADDAGVVLVEG